MAIIPQPANFPIPHKASTRMPSGLNTSSSRQHNTAPSMLPIAGTLMIVGSAIYDAVSAYILPLLSLDPYLTDGLAYEKETRDSRYTINPPKYRHIGHIAGCWA